MDKAEILLYQPDNKSARLAVRFEDETVWLTQAQMYELFQTTRNNISLHISNIFNENELEENSVCKDSLLTAADGKRYNTKLYNLDVIISVGYRMKEPDFFIPSAMVTRHERVSGIKGDGVTT